MDIPLFDTLETLPLDNAIKNPDTEPNTNINDGTTQADPSTEQPNQCVILDISKPHQSSRVAQPSLSGIQSSEYCNQEALSKDKGLDWATNHKLPTALSH